MDPENQAATSALTVTVLVSGPEFLATTTAVTVTLLPAGRSPSSYPTTVKSFVTLPDKASTRRTSFATCGPRLVSLIL